MKLAYFCDFVACLCDHWLLEFSQPMVCYIMKKIGFMFIYRGGTL